MLEIPKKYNFLKYLHSISWEDIFAVWRVSEAYQKSWEEHWVERGFDSWEAWRKNYIKSIKPEQKKWFVYRIENPLENMQFIYGTPTRGWIKKCYNGEITKQISEILTHPIITENDKVAKIRQNFPYQTMITGIVSEGKVVLVEGMHRVVTLALMGKNGEKYEGDIVIALAEQERILPLGKGDEENKKAIIKIHGKVQGVFFRKFAKDKMRELGIFGKAENNEDGTVIIKLESPEYILQEFLEWCKIGSPNSKVEKVEFKLNK